MKEKKELKNNIEMPEEKTVQTLDQPDYIGEILSLIRSNTSPIILREKLDDYHENDIADALPQLQPNERQKTSPMAGTSAFPWHGRFFGCKPL